MEKILNDVKHVLNENHVVISTITGFKIERIESFIGNHIPIIRSMPNTAISVGKSMTCLCSNKVGEKTIDIAMAIFNGLGTSIKIAEEHMQAATVICASGIAFWMRLIRAQRRVLKDMRAEETLTPSEYRYYYRKAKGGSYRSVAHMRTNMGLDGIKIGGDE